ncbi:DUF3718 domain-containing protein [Aliiglaciecola sp. CAU 1673]|uniref:DUF3718 domain-containing protein n=1 Tax=Aliiglaciecola sp. CAU 1673 TaxID=3032595 RepID=UPI0023DB2F83|nr:DUF3718 domain-containing protein [Aliiglaciecola sp. CAU 1673]MDF2177770.1 DUF3718 domain-containing protein [Aliiglaciecola sp. CAU 1673]
MKAITLFSAVALGVSANAAAMTDDYIEAALIEVCESVMSNKPFKLKDTLREHRLDVPTINEKLLCNSESPYRFALTHSATRTANILSAGRVDIKDIAKTESKINVTIGH